MIKESPKADSKNQEIFKRDLSKTSEAKVSEQENPAFHNDRHFFRFIAYSLGAMIFFGTLGMILLAWLEREIPDGLTAVVSAAIGALAGVLAGKGK